uniref:Uncharacterized protein n=1 Tax=Chromera velia CCMP2878 TaxID=1169474 RepID=A0A0G4IDU4_9ALVE|eukprot:Cvel_2378.t1-p1 / transcript=Cvel_2378.t1 / gene=Cvel_2378 / organism=Chromera_velia_CCMP2878 / gene_product=hypothetical protein / transcript_product=hypothetical protein / location=Cvel_scaffold92:57492-58271(+) / protein_length=260 / sequence_SO=supercontig / SO=protein_coding / is_pseudo=false
MMRQHWAEVIGEALTHAEASLNSLEEVLLLHKTEKAISAFLAGINRGAGSLKVLRSFLCGTYCSIRIQGAQSLHAFVRGGKVPSLKELTVNLAGIGQEGMQAFAAALSTSHASALRRLEVKFGGVGPADAAAEVELFSVALSSGYLRRLGELSVGGLGMIGEVQVLCMGLGSGELTSLRKIQLTGVGFRKEGGRDLSEVLIVEKLPSLRSLDAKWAGLTGEGLRALAGGWMTRTPPPLKHLNLKCTKLTGGVADALSTLL